MSVEKLLLSEPVRQLDLSAYCIVTADTSVRDTIARMRLMGQNCAFIIGRGTQLIGILTDRDVLKKVVAAPVTWDQPVETVMTPAPDTIRPGATAGEALRMMEEGRYRNVPVINEQGVIRGNVNQFAILQFLVGNFPEAVFNLPPDPTNYAEKREGG